MLSYNHDLETGYETGEETRAFCPQTEWKWHYYFFFYLQPLIIHQSLATSEPRYFSISDIRHCAWCSYECLCGLETMATKQNMLGRILISFWSSKMPLAHLNTNSCRCFRKDHIPGRDPGKKNIYSFLFIVNWKPLYALAERWHRNALYKWIHIPRPLFSMTKSYAHW